ncbi:MAG: ribosomal-protein-alanine N-acetyltransferase [Candidatus Rokubacteria bacterium GWC2_70_24]|nr:MAG: ribosomal-protein-alanine N-acetyltransferase [Candidatus Rokubacteria bacterium GWA2_70_23]OGK92091.1 MAG: ribosomal-protein-alanine N-acetyltransferase [Candidatus Rokubacteria bacterium GWF2_70_14]OGK92997.1 MAG: ribosomal-protein-alanine N-acetyltransferase [Candidatus Rokubacteria bacterium GWC2_70_24]
MAETQTRPPLSLAPMTLDDLDDVLAIERVSFKTPWSRAAFRYELAQNRVARCMVARAGARLCGYLCLWEIGHEIHITNLAVHPEWRRRGIARALLESILADGRARGVLLAFLEVRPTNVEALGLYGSLGFRIIGERKGYYFDTGEDALVMEADFRLSQGAAPADETLGTVG